MHRLLFSLLCTVCQQREGAMGMDTLIVEITINHARHSDSKTQLHTAIKTTHYNKSRTPLIRLAS
jgi:hypothetical protein